MSPWFAEGMITLYHMFKVNGATAQTLETVERITGRPPRTLSAYLKENEAYFKSVKHAGAAQTAKTREEQKQN
jgi:hypothetical protein